MCAIHLFVILNIFTTCMCVSNVCLFMKERLNERDLASAKFGDFNGTINWNKCLLEVESPLGKHYLQDTYNQTGLLDNVIITENDQGKYELHDQNADKWTMFGQKGSELLLMCDCGNEAVAIFARVPYWPAANDLYAVLHRSGIAPLGLDKVICSPLNKISLSSLNHYFSKHMYKG